MALLQAKPLLEQDKIKELVDPSLGDSYDEMQLIRAANTARSCIQHSPVMRPCMSKVISALTGEEDEGDSRITTHQKETGRRTNSEGTDDDDEDEYNETKNLNDLDRHKQIAFDFQNQSSPATTKGDERQTLLLSHSILAVARNKADAKRFQKKGQSSAGAPMTTAIFRQARSYWKPFSSGWKFSAVGKQRLLLAVWRIQ
ncbi:hypothetical protein ZIOFF_011433 [Zingiber officinale]|uniref:Uncharacterized protein n=1 Tax=Zingiber officinale TaxID=94328 RepID=A0A8J5I5Z0_ZINOF|nr:hypothetical protein ZIOFF_011433 [Zingiber officinale]